MFTAICIPQISNLNQEVGVGVGGWWWCWVGGWVGSGGGGGVVVEAMYINKTFNFRHL